MLRANVIMTSAKTGEGISEAFDQISRQLIEKEDTELYAISASNTLINLDTKKQRFGDVKIGGFKGFGGGASGPGGNSGLGNGSGGCC